MPRALLNLAGLRASRSQSTSQVMRENPDDPAMSRRRALGLAGVTAAGAAPALRAVEDSLLGSFELVRGKGRVAFRAGGVDRWVVDVRRFAGSPALTLQQTTDAIQLQLHGARYPGTDLPADFTCVVRRALTGWTINLDMALGGFAAKGPFLPWLMGLSALESRVRLESAHIGLGTRATLTLAGAGRAAFTPDWLWTISGTRIAAVRNLGRPLPAGTLQLSLPAPEAPSLIRAQNAKRTLVNLWRGTNTWDLQPAFAPNGLWSLLTPSNAFNSIHFELDEDAAGHRAAALVAEAADSLIFQPHSGLRAASGTAASLPLAGARYAIAFDPAGDQRSLVARFGAQPTWLAAGSCAVEVGDAPGAPPFELVAHGSTVTAVHCTPAVLRASIPVAGAAAAPATIPPGTLLAFVAKGLERSGAQHAAQITLSDHPTAAFQRFTLVNPRFSVVRPDDLLALTFEFINLTVDVSAPNKPPQLVHRLTKTGKGSAPPAPPYLAVHIQGQNIAEQAFFQVESAVAVPANPDPLHTNLPPDPDAGKKGEFPDGTPHFPVDKRLAGESRLVFAMPAGFTALPLTLQALLDWAQLIPSVPPTALPAGGYTKAPIADPLPTETSLEIPWRLQISPNQFSGWIHSFTPVTHKGWTELWHTRLGVKVPIPATKHRAGQVYLVDTHYAYQAQTTPDGTKYAVTLDTYVGGKPADLLQPFRTIRAIWSPDLPPPYAHTLPDNNPFRSSLTGLDRLELVALTSNFAFATPPKTTPVLPIVPIHVLPWPPAKHRQQGPSIPLLCTKPCLIAMQTRPLNRPQPPPYLPSGRSRRLCQTPQPVPGRYQSQ